MEQILYLECSAGISGDMVVAALLDLGADRENLEAALKSIPDKSFSVEIGRIKKAGIDCCDFKVCLDAAHENHDHDMEYLHGSRHHGYEAADDAHGGSRAHHHEHGEAGHHSHEKGQAHGHAHRGLKEIRDIIGKVDMTENARRLALKIFEIIAGAEAKAHAVPVEQVHFHEVGAIDSIVDVVAAAVCLDSLAVKNVVIPKLCEGQGFVRCQHGMLPVPVPAVSNIVTESGLVLEIMDVEGEFVTPTGAAIAAAVCTGNSLPKGFRIKKIGLGAGKRTYEKPSILRAMLIEDNKKDDTSVYCLESNMDDCSGEILGYLMEKLMAAGARDACYSPVYMKKNRPAWKLTVLCEKEDIPKLENIIFRESTTIGIRRYPVERTVLPRELQSVMTKWGETGVKICRHGERVEYYPEYEGARILCEKSGLPYKEIYQEIISCCKK